MANKNSRHAIRLSAAAAVLYLSPLAAHSAPGTLAERPLFLGGVQPNIFFMIDDSGSMDWEVLKSNGAIAAYGTGSNSGNLDFTPDDDTERLELCAGYNVLAYDPNATYTPWLGKDNAGNAYPDMTLAAARPNPYDPSSTTDISSQFYFVWNDNGDGVFQAGECPTPAVTSASDCSSDATAACKLVSQLSAAQQTNYANWYTYYRKREYVVKRALSQIMSQSTARMGLGSLHNNGSVRTLVQNINDISTPVDPVAQQNKQTLLNNLFNVYSSGGTPLRTGLEQVGDYFEGNNANWGPTPIQSAAEGGSCQQNFTILMSDGFWNGSSPGVGNTDGDNDTSFDGASYADTVSSTLADVAMDYYERDLAAGLPNRVPTVPGVDDNSAQHLVTYTVSFGVNGTLSSNPPNRTDPFTWPTPIADDLTTIDDMRHAAWNGRGRFLSAADPQALIDSLNNSIADISDRVGNAAAVTFNTTALEAGSAVYLALFNSNRWSGQLLSYPLDGTTGAVGATPLWDAGAKLDSASVTSDNRTIITYNGSSGAPFRWSNLTGSQQDDLRTNSSGTLDNAATGTARLGFLRGDRACESGAAGSCSYSEGGTSFSTKNFRARSSRLGDIVHSAPVYVGAPELNWPDVAPFPTGTNSYSAWKSTSAIQSRTPVIYTGANDGMLHGFRTSDGKEVLGYVPKSLFSTNSGEGLHYLTDPMYSHRYYVDLTPTVSDVYINGGWKSILVGGERGGGRGLFALDVTNPSNYNEANASSIALWEFTEADLGYTFSRPTLALLNNGRWAAVFGNGYNDTGSGTAQLFIVFLDPDLSDGWTLGTDPSDPATDYIKISTQVGSVANRNGMSTPGVVDIDGNGTADRVYAGDLTGNMWVFDLCNATGGACQGTGWGVAYQQGSTPIPLFTGSTNQPITGTPILVRNPDVTTSNSNEPNLIILFGTGQYLTDPDKTSTDVQTFYGVWDSGASGLSRTDLVEQTIVTGTPSGSRVVTSNPIPYSASGNSQRFGWYLDLPASGERVVTNPTVRGSLVYFNTTIPSTSPCDHGGTGWLMSMEYSNGGSPESPAFDYNHDGFIDDNDLLTVDGEQVAPAGQEFNHGLPASPNFLGNKQYTPGSDTTNGQQIDVRDVQSLGGANTGRLSWQELAQ